MVQYGGIVAVACMSVAMILALRPRWPENWFGGLDKMYRLHKWLGIAALVVAVTHWLWAKGPKWAVGWGWLERPQRGPRPLPDNAIAQLTAAAAAAGVRLHVLVDARDGRLNGDRIRQAVPQWRDTSFWFCGPAAFGHALRHDFAAHGLPVKQRFHQELFAIR